MLIFNIIDSYPDFYLLRLNSVHPETIINQTMFSIRKGGIFCKVKEIKGLCGDVLLYVAQANLKIDAEIAKKHPFRMKTK